MLLYAVVSALVLPVLFSSGSGCLLLPKIVILSLWSGLPVSMLGMLKMVFVAGGTSVPAASLGLVLAIVMLLWAMKVVLHGLVLEPTGEVELPSFWFLLKRRREAVYTLRVRQPQRKCQV